MRRTLTKLPNPIIGNATKQAQLSSSFPFSTSSSGGGGGGGGGRGRGRGFDSPDSRFSQEPPSPLDRGHGRGTQPPPPIQKPSMSFVAPPSIVAPSHGRGRGGGPVSFIQPEPIHTPDDEPVESPFPNPRPSNLNPQGSISSILSEGLGGQGRGKPTQPATAKPTVENRHLRSRRGGDSSKPIGEKEPSTRRPKLSQQEAIDRARSVLSRGEGDIEGEGSGNGRGSSIRGRGRGRGGRGQLGGGRGRRGPAFDDSDDDEDDVAYDNVNSSEVEQADEEAFRDSLAMDLGEEKADMVVEAFEEASESALPSPLEDAYVDAMDVNYMIECEPEYMVDFGNPDLDEKPPVPLQEALEKMKPFLMAYEDIRTDEEWEEVVKDTMANVPLMKKIVDDYGGPDRVTAKRQQEELERVAKTLPGSAPCSVKRFTDRAVLSLQSNPGWGFHRKCQFMDKLVAEVSQSYK